MAFRAWSARRSDLLLQPALERAALRVQVEHHAVVNYWVDRREGVHGIFENYLPFGENQIGRDHDAAALIALGEECEEDFHSQAFRGFLDRERIEIIRLTAAKVAEFECLRQAVHALDKERDDPSYYDPSYVLFGEAQYIAH